MSLHKNQQHAIQTSVKNDFLSGVHAHATGTGKSWIALQLLLEFNARYPHANVLWICEQKTILQEQFLSSTIQKKGFASLKAQYMFMDYSTRKSPAWVEELSMASVWRKPLLVIINRAFLVSGNKYLNLRTSFGLIIHDECHSIVNSTTREFYNFALTKWINLSCIGFSATPVLEHVPFKRLLSQYSIYNGVIDKVILPPKIHWLKSEAQLGYDDALIVLQEQLKSLPYKKILVWCGMIQHCEDIAAKWSPYMESHGILTAIDTSAKQLNVARFMDAEQNAILFCAAKHREGSDIKNLDCCIFLDNVEERAAKVFVQCVGRVLRRDSAAKKTHGLIIDISALSSIKICDRINQFMNAGSTFPFTYNCNTINVNRKMIKLHTLTMQQELHAVASGFTLEVPPSIKVFFVRDLPNKEDYVRRLEYEIALIEKKNLIRYLMQAVEVLKITEGIPHVTRGSCGSSLLCYALGISHVDPVAYNISFARFLTEFRNTLPDIDFDFPYNLRDEVFLQLELRWPGAVARISNHVFYHKKSALREAIRRIGIRKQIRSVELYGVIRRLKVKERQQIENTVKTLENTFRTYSLHCGGVVFYPNGVPENLRLRSKRSTTLAQIMLNKHDVARDANFKIDILSSRALAQLYEANRFETIAFESWTADDAVADLFCRGDNIGLTLAESPLCRKAFMKFKPRSIDDIAMCLAIIRPAARAARTAKTMKDMDAHCIYDDDAINFISMALGCGEEKADYYRRGLIKGDAAIKEEFATDLKKLRADARKTLTTALVNMRAYSFCKSHAYSYAQLIWKLAWMKVYRPKEFWEAALKHCHSSYKRWVLLYEAHLAGAADVGPKMSIYATAKKCKATKSAEESQEDCLRRLGYWDFSTGFIPDCYYYQRAKDGSFRGLIASSRYLSYDDEVKTAVLFICVAPRTYIEVIVSGKRLSLQGKIGIQGIGLKIDEDCQHTYECAEGKYSLY